MVVRKATRAGAPEAHDPRVSVQLGGVNGYEANSKLAEIQAFRLADRLGLGLPRARILAPFVFDGGAA